MPKINQEEYEVLKGLNDKWKWVARDKNNTLWIYVQEPRKDTWSAWQISGIGATKVNIDWFQFIQWEDEEPYNIAELIEEYESEETEVKKDMKWFKKKLDDIEVNTTSLQNHDAIWMLNRVHELYDQLDEPETLSEYWLEPKSIDDGGRLYVWKSDLRALLVLEQELPVIPKFVDEYLRKNFTSLQLTESKQYVIWQTHRDLFRDCLSEDMRRFLGGKNNFNEAVINGYIVEEEPLYRARLKVITDEFIASYLRTQSSDAEDRLKALEIGSKYIHEDYRHLSEFTEDELKRLDIWDSEQWEVEELEE